MQRTIAKTKLQDLIASERASNAEIRKAQKEFDVLNKKVAAAMNIFTVWWGETCFNRSFNGPTFLIDLESITSFILFVKYNGVR